MLITVIATAVCSLTDVRHSGRKPASGIQTCLGVLLNWKKSLKMPENFNIQSLHGSYFTAEICFNDVVGRIFCKDDEIIYLCHDNPVVGIKPIGCSDYLGHEYAWPAIFVDGKLDDSVQNLKILPSPLEYHELFTELLEKRGAVWEDDGSYSVIPNEVMDKIRDFLKGIKIFRNN